MPESDAHRLGKLQQASLFEQAERKRGDSKATKRANLRTLSAETFRNLYFEQGKNLREVADILGFSSTAVHKWFRRHRSEFADNLRSRFKRSKYKVNEQFFSCWTPEMAYVLGVLATDGHIGRWTVDLTSTDVELVEKVKSLMGSNHPIRTRVPRGWSRKTQYYLQISSIKLAQALTDFGVGPAKSRTLTFPQMPEEYARHFLRGCWDGDGSFYFEGGKRFKASFVSGSKEFIEGIVRSLAKAGFRQRLRWVWRRHVYVKDSDEVKVYTSHRGKNPAYSIRLSGQNAIVFGRFIYDSVPESMYLARKYELFRSAATEYALPIVTLGEPGRLAQTF